ncbi:MAG TPA: glycine betaine ABC transporter substrate-binding protein [Candidatus Eremiobacteraceae bacterium]|nr:glycine betaine ABC transporter substrate-binding protein [Candidatus Eremiobacteraceae bacterium]
MMPNRISRRAALAGLTALALAPAACARRNAVKVGSKNFTEELILGQMYAALLEHAGLPVERRLDLGSTQVIMPALARGDIDLYPEYTGTALLVVLKAAPLSDRRAVYDLVKTQYAQRYDLVLLDPAPMNDTQALATTQALAAKYGLRDLSDCAREAPKLRLGAPHEFLERPDGLPGLVKAYGGFAFARVVPVDIGLKYKALETGAVDVVVAFGTDGQIDTDHLVVLDDDRHFFPPYAVAPVVRAVTLQAHPQIAPTLNRLAPLLTDTVMRRLNQQVDGQRQEPDDVARAFLTQAALI